MRLTLGLGLGLGSGLGLGVGVRVAERMYDATEGPVDGWRAVEYVVQPG